MDSSARTGAPPTGNGGAGGLLGAGIYPLFFISGFAALTYEVLWTRALLYIFGAGVLAISVVLAAFMAGLALGSAALGRLADRLRRPLRAFAAIELGIGACALALPWALGSVEAVNRWAYGQFGQNFVVLSALRFIVTFGFLLIPTCLMGATLPVLARARVRSAAHVGSRVGGLYAINTAGAVAGAFACGFFLIERFGISATGWIAVSLNVATAAGALALSLMTEGGAAPIAPEAEPIEPEGSGGATLDPDRVRLVLAAAFVTGAVSLAAQVIWFRSLVFAFDYLKNTTYAFSAILTVFLAGLAIGSALIGPIADRTQSPMRLYGVLLTLLGVALALSTGALRRAPPGWLPNPLAPGELELNWPAAVASIMAQSTRVLGAATLLMGMALPVAARAVVRAGRVGRQVGVLFALNTGGAILGSLLACFAIVPFFGLTGGLLALALVDGGLGLYLIYRSPGEVGWPLKVMVAIAAGLFVLSLASLRGVHLQRLQPFEQLLHYDEGPLATVAVVRNSFGHDTLYVDGVGVAGSDPILQTDQKSLAHMPMMLARDPKSALTVGFGSGGASHSFLLHDRLEVVDCVEISNEVIRAAPFFDSTNHGLMRANDPRYRIVMDDARSYLRYTDRRYDIIATDCTDLRYKSNANLYDEEYFQFCRERLNEGGLVVVWMPLAGLSVEMFKLALRTFHAVFPGMGVFFMNNEPTHYVLLIGGNEPLEIDLARIEARLTEEDVRADLAAYGLADPLKIASSFMTGGEALAAYLGEGPINTEDTPHLEFKSPRYGYGDEPAARNLASLEAARAPVADWITPGSMDEATREALARYEAAAPHIIEGHGHFRRLDIEAATRAYLAAARLTPEDASVTRLLEFADVERKTRVRGTTPIWAWVNLGRSFMIQGRDVEAYDALERGVLIFNQLPEEARGAIERGLARNARGWMEEVGARILAQRAASRAQPEPTPTPQATPPPPSN